MNFEFNQCSCLGAVWRKLSRQWTTRYPKEHTYQISAQSVEWLRSSSYNKFEFNRCSRLGVLTQKLSRQCTTRYPKDHIYQISAQSVQRFRNYGANKKLQTYLVSYLPTQLQNFLGFKTSHLRCEVKTNYCTIGRR